MMYFALLLLIVGDYIFTNRENVWFAVQSQLMSMEDKK